MSNDQSQKALKTLAFIAGVIILASLVLGPGGGIVTIVALAAKLLWLVFLVTLAIGVYVALKNNFGDFQFSTRFHGFENGFVERGRICPECGTTNKQNFNYCPSCGNKMYSERG